MIKNRQLEHALALHKHESFHRAAQAMHLSQPAFSRSIRNLERQLGVTLFDRGPGGVRPTLFGEALLKRAHSIVEETQELRREIELLQGLESGGLSVAMGPYPSELSGGRAAGELIRRYPKLKAQFTLGDWRKIGTQVLTRSIDLGFADVSEAQTYDELVVEVVGRHPLIFFARKDHHLAKLPKVTKAKIDRYPLVAIRIPARVARNFPGKAVTEELTNNLIPSIEVEDLAMARIIVAGSDAISAAIPSQVPSLLETGQFALLRYMQSELKLKYGFIYRRDRMLSPAAEMFMKLVRDIEISLEAENRQLLDAIWSDAGDVC